MASLMMKWKGIEQSNEPRWKLRTPTICCMIYLHDLFEIYNLYRPFLCRTLTWTSLRGGCPIWTRPWTSSLGLTTARRINGLRTKQRQVLAPLSHVNAWRMAHDSPWVYSYYLGIRIYMLRFWVHHDLSSDSTWTTVLGSASPPSKRTLQLLQYYLTSLKFVAGRLTTVPPYWTDGGG